MSCALKWLKLVIDRREGGRAFHKSGAETEKAERERDRQRERVF